MCGEDAGAAADKCLPRFYWLLLLKTCTLSALIFDCSCVHMVLHVQNNGRQNGTHTLPN